jgi:protein-S-isoprenylcysteine O-methyltransferase Ste14
MSSDSPQGGDTETARTVTGPPFLFLAALVLGFVSDHLWRLPFPISKVGQAHWISAAVAGLLILMGIAVFAAAIRDLSRAGTPVQGTRPTRALVTTGIFGWSRNPIYVGMFLIYVGIGLVVRSPWILIFALPLAIIMHYGVVAREEAYLERRFGDVFGVYKTHVRRWL